MNQASISIGSIELRVLVDGADRVPPEMILADAPPDDLRSAVAGRVDGEGLLPVAYNGLLIRSAGRLVLVDAGFGDLGDAEGVGGGLGAALRALGVQPTDLDAVVVTHGHADHIGGLIRTVAGRVEPVFTRSGHWFWRDEWQFWTSEEALGALPRDLADPARTALPPLAAAGLVQLLDAETEVAEGVRVMAAPGHTPGHAVVRIESGGERAMYLGDAVFHPLNVERPDWTCIFDVDRSAAARTRRGLLEQAVRDRSLVLAAHVAGAGRIESGAGGYRWLVGD